MLVITVDRAALSVECATNGHARCRDARCHCGCVFHAVVCGACLKRHVDRTEDECRAWRRLLVADDV